MKWILCVTVLLCVCSNKVNAAKTNKPKTKDPIHLEVDSNIYKNGENFLEEGTSKKIACKGKLKSQKIEWYDPQGNLVSKNSKNRVFVTEPLSINPTVYLVFTTLEADDSGTWECRSGERVEKVSLCVMDPASLDEPKEITIDERRSVTLTCQTSGNPEPRIQWYKDGELLEEDGEKFYTGLKYNQHGLEGLLTIRSLAPEDMGVYVCEAIQQSPTFEDCNNTATVNITLYVNHAPKFYIGNKKEHLTYVEDGENVTIVCNPSAYPKPQFRWFTGNNNMATEISSKQYTLSEDGSSLFIIANSQNYNQKFKCKAKNDFGEEYMTYRILRMQEPSELSATTDFVPYERAIYFNITWEPCLIDRIDIQYFEKTSIGEPKEWQWESAKISSYPLENDPRMENLKINTEYWVRLRGSNEHGDGPWSHHMLLSTAYESEAVDIGIFLGVVVTAVVVLFGAGCITLIKKL